MKLKVKPVPIIIIILLLTMMGTMGFKIFILGYTLPDIIPQVSYSIEIFMSFLGNENDVFVRTFLPGNEQTQMISEKTVNSPFLDFREHSTPHFIQGEWSAYETKGPYQISYSFHAQMKSIYYTIDTDLQVPDGYSEGFDKYLEETEFIQVNHPVIEDIAHKLIIDKKRIYPIVKSIYEYVYSMDSRPFKGTTDAITAAQLGEASCNGKSRLFVALLRHSHIPARLVGGLILTTGSKRTSHQWLEVYIAGHWIPFDALNGHFAHLPDNYLILYRGDESLFVHSRNIKFDYRFNIRKKTVANNQLTGFLGGHGLNLYNILSAFKRINISLNILTFLLVIPLGVLVVVIFRNIIGLRTFGTFLPALMAIAVRETGLFIGVGGFLFVLLITIIIRTPLNKLGVLHTPKLAILMIITIASLLFLTVLSDVIRIDELSSIGAVSLFPIAILTLTAERFAITLEEDGLKDAVITMGWTIGVMCLCYLVMNLQVIHALMLAFPELLLGIIAINLWIGSWTGLRISEFLRFKSIYADTNPDQHTDT